MQTNGDFCEWCGLTDTSQLNPLLVVNKKIHLNEIYYDFTNSNPDYARGSKFSVSHFKFKNWMLSYSKYTQGIEAEVGRDMTGKWIRIKPRSEAQIQTKLI